MASTNTQSREATAAIQVTAAAATKLAEIAAEQGCDPALRIEIQGGGCGGFQYALSFAETWSDLDSVTEIESVDGGRVVIGPESQPYLRGATVDFCSTLTESGFKINNPNATSSCGCGQSFRVDDEDCPSV